MLHTIIKENCYYDSIFLMKASKKMKQVDGVNRIVLVMGTEVNKSVLQDAGMLTPKAQSAAPGSLIIALDAETQEQVQDALNCLEELNCAHEVTEDREEHFSSLEQVLHNKKDRNLAVISLPGEYASVEAKSALKAGMNVFIFSDNVPLEEEIMLKQYAKSRDLFVMGPGCGTAVINGISLGIMSRIRKGSIGVVGASGSGLQEICVLADRMGYGVSQAIGTGGRDLSREVGGITMLQGIDYLSRDPETRVLVLVSKPPHPDTCRKIYDKLGEIHKPAVIYFLGGDREEIEASGAFSAASLEEAAVLAVGLCSGKTIERSDYIGQVIHELKDKAAREAEGKTTDQRYVRGLYCGGTHSEEAALLLKNCLPLLYSNVHFAGLLPMEDPGISREHCLIDMGDEWFTVGRPHPVIDPSILSDRLIKEGTDPETSVLLFDLLLGYGIHKDPVGTIEDALATIQEKNKEAGRHLTMVCALCGTDADPQGFEDQKRRLEDKGVIVFASNARAALFAGLAVKGRMG